MHTCSPLHALLRTTRQKTPREPPSQKLGGKRAVARPLSPLLVAPDGPNERVVARADAAADHHVGPLDDLPGRLRLRRLQDRVGSPGGRLGRVAPGRRLPRCRCRPCSPGRRGRRRRLCRRLRRLRHLLHPPLGRCAGFCFGFRSR